MNAEPAPVTTTAVRPARPVNRRVRGALGRYRIAAFVVGWGLLLLCVTVVAKYGFGWSTGVAVWGPIHGVLYVAYVLLTFDLAYKNRWSLLGILKVLLAGVIPVLSFVVERWVHRRVLAGEKI